MDPVAELVQEARHKSSKAILTGEQFKISVNKPPGKESEETIRMGGQYACELDVDDQFFHVSCHIDKTLRAKIEKGEFVDLEKLLLKNKFNRNTVQDNKLE